MIACDEFVKDSKLSLVNNLTSESSLALHSGLVGKPIRIIFEENNCEMLSKHTFDW